MNGARRSDFCLGEAPTRGQIAFDVLGLAFEERGWSDDTNIVQCRVSVAMPEPGESTLGLSARGYDGLYIDRLRSLPDDLRGLAHEVRGTVEWEGYTRAFQVRIDRMSDREGGYLVVGSLVYPPHDAENWNSVARQQPFPYRLQFAFRAYPSELQSAADQCEEFLLGRT